MYTFLKSNISSKQSGKIPGRDFINGDGRSTHSIRLANESVLRMDFLASMNGCEHMKTPENPCHSGNHRCFFFIAVTDELPYLSIQ